MNILHYTQHVLGIGHLFRSLAIDAALAPAVVHLVTGGPEVNLDPCRPMSATTPCRP